MGSGFRTFAASEVLTSSNVQNYLMTQSVMYFVSESARDTAITSPVAGMVAFIDSNDANEGLYVYHGATGGWRKGPGWNAPWGVVSSAQTSASALVASETVVSTGQAFTAVANRQYRWTFTTSTVGNVANDVFECLLRKNNVAGTAYAQRRFTTPPTGQSGLTISVFMTPGAGAFTPVASFLRVTGTGQAGTIQTIQHLIEDIGPSGAPA
jgi:hypothetical protein